MAKVKTTTLECDVCEVSSEVTEYTVHAQGKGAVEVDLCALCAVPLRQLTDKGRVVNRPGRPRTKVAPRPVVEPTQSGFVVAPPFTGTIMNDAEQDDDEPESPIIEPFASTGQDAVVVEPDGTVAGDDSWTYPEPEGERPPSEDAGNSEDSGDGSVV